MSGRPASTKIQIGDLALSVGRPQRPAPQGWKWIELNELAEMATGHTPSRNHPEYWGGDIKWMCASDARFRHGGAVYETADTINRLGIENSAAVVLPKDTVCLARTGASIGYAVRLAEPMATNQGFVNWVCGPNLNPKFYQFILVAEGEFLRRIAYGAAHHTIYFPEVKAFYVCIPPLTEQERIVSVLDEAFAGLATAQAHAEKNLQNARALFESHLESVFTQCGKGWLETRIGECIHFIDYRGKTPMKTESGVRLITAKNVKMGYLQTTPMEFIATQSYESWMTRGIPKKGDVLFTTEAPLANVAQLDTAEKVAFAQRIIIMQPYAAKLDGTFLKYLLLSGPVQRRIRTHGTGATVQGIKASLLKTIEISFPPTVREQELTAAKLDALSTETQRLETLYQKKLSALDALKKSLLHQAFSGAL